MRTSIPPRSSTIVIWTLTAFMIASLLLYGVHFTKSIQESDRLWRDYSQWASMESFLLSRIQQELGYGGFIHNFKNLVLRQDLQLSKDIQSNISKLDAYFIQYRALLAENPQALQNMETLFKTYDEYKNNLVKAQQLIATQTYTSKDIDAQLKVEDQAAITSLQNLSAIIMERRHNIESESKRAFRNNLQLIYWGILPLALIGLYAVFIVSLLKRLKNSTKLGEDILKASSGAIIVSDQNHIIEQANPYAATLTQYSEEQLRGMPIQQLLPEFQLNGVNHTQLTLLNQKADQLTVDITQNKVFDGNEVLYVININDLTEEIEQRKALEQRKSMLDQAQSVAKLGCWQWELASDTLTLSKEAKRIYGFQEDDTRFSHERLSRRIPLDEREEVANAINESILLKKPYHIIHRIQLDDESIRHVEQSGELTTDKNGKVTAMLGVVADISEKFLAEKEMSEREAMLNQAQAVSKAGCWKWDLTTNLVSLSEEAKRIYAVSSEKSHFSLEVLSKKIPAKEREHVVNAINESVLLRTPYHVFHSISQEEHSNKMVEQFGELTLDENGKVLAMLGVVKDVTAQQETEYELKLAANVFNFSHEALIVSNSEYRILKVNPTFEKIMGYSEHEVLGRALSTIVDVDNNDKNIFQEIGNDLVQHENWKGEIWLSRKNKETFPSKQTISAVKNANDEVVQYISLFSDITQEKKQEEHIRGLAHYCQLTKLPNRVLFNDRLKQSLIRSQRNQLKLALLFIDLDRFKYVNDTLGHDAGDELLRQISKRLTNSVRKQDTVARLGGDEFTMILEDIRETKDVFIVTDKIIHSVNEVIQIGGHEVVVGASIGISAFPLHGDDAEALIKCADTAMYHAKESGKNQAMLYKEAMSISTSQHFNLEHKLRKALEQNQMELYFQPQVDLELNAVTGCEALVRWIHPDEGIISPADFIPLAEETGLIVPLGTWVLKESLKRCQQWQSEGLTDLSICVNVSSKQLATKGFEKIVEQMLEEASFPPERLVLEVTESVVIENPDETVKTLKYIRDMGIKLALDDFGTGYSSLSYLKKLPIHKVKIDRAFVRDMHDDKDDEEIVKTIIAMSTILGLQVVAEGAETADQVALIHQFGCSVIQGFFYAKPMPEQQFIDFALDFNQAPPPLINAQKH